MTNTDKKMFLEKCTALPASYFSIPLGLGALAIAWQRAEGVFQFHSTASTALGSLAIAFWMIFVLIYLSKIIICPDNFKKEFQSPVASSLITLIAISTIVIGELLFLWGNILLGEPIIFIGIVLQLIYAFCRVGILWKGEILTTENALPPFYLPTVAANFTSASGLALLGYYEIAWLFFGAGFFSWLIFEPTLLSRLRNQSTPNALLPSFGIILAPAFVGVNAYLVVAQGQLDVFAKMMWGYGLLQLLFLLRLLPWIIKTSGGVDARFWSFSFGLASMASSSMLLYKNQAMHYLGLSAFIFANIAMALLLLFTFIRILQGKFFKLG